MGDESDDYRNEDSEPLMDVDEEIQSDLDEPQQHLLDNRDHSLHDSHERSPDPVWKRKIAERTRKGEKGEKKFKIRKSGGGRIRDHEADPETKEMWDTIAGGNSEV